MKKNKKKVKNSDIKGLEDLLGTGYESYNNMNTKSKNKLFDLLNDLDIKSANLRDVLKVEDLEAAISAIKYTFGQPDMMWCTESELEAFKKTNSR